MNYLYIWNVKIKRGYPFWTASSLLKSAACHSEASPNFIGNNEIMTVENSKLCG